MSLTYLFVYGTLRRGCNNPMAQFLARNSHFIGKASYQGKLYRVNYYPGLVASAHPEDEVKGEVYQLHDAETVLTCLDDYEGCGANHLSPTEYIRRQDSVKLEHGEILLAWLYVYNFSIAGLEVIKSGDFLSVK